MKLYYSNNSISYEDISSRLNVEALEFNEEISDSLYLLLENDILYLSNEKTRMCVNFSDIYERIKRSGITNELLVKASKFKDKKDNLTAIDATAGFGTDSFILAYYGFNVKMFENNKVIYELVNNGLLRALKDINLNSIVSRMELVNSSSIDYMNNTKDGFDLIYLDPMFAEKEKSSLVKKKFQLIHLIETPCNNELELFESACKVNVKKIVVKRPIKGDYLAGKKPSYQIKGKAIRYDCYINIH